jgi:site-specific recombinase XerD
VEAIVRVRSWPDVESAIKQLIQSRRSNNTRCAYRDDWEKWLVFVGANNVDLKVPGLVETTAFRDALESQDYAPASITRILSSLSFFYSALRDAGLLRANPFAKTWLPRPEVSDLHKTPAIEDSMVVHLEAAVAKDLSWRGKRDAAIIQLLYGTGLRRASLATLRREQLRRVGNDLIAFVTVKGGKTRSVKITESGRLALEAWLTLASPSTFVFPQENDPSKHLSLTTFNKILTARSKQAGLAETASPHQFRAAFITTAYDAHVYERDIQAAAHHANSATTRGYDRGSRGDDVFTQVAAHRTKKKNAP